MERQALTLRLALALVLVPLILAAADVAASRTTFKFLLLPPFGALTYLVFINPARLELGARQIVLSMTLTAVWAWLLASAIGYTAPSVILAVAGTMAIMWASRAHMVVPPMALALLTLLLHTQVRWHPEYLASVLVFTVAVYLMHRIWARLPLDRTLWHLPPHPFRRDHRPDRA